MGKLIYAIASLDGYVADADGKFDWGEPDEEVHTFVNDLERPVGTYLYGRRLYEVMVVWDDAEAFSDQPPHIQDFARLWQAADKVVYSTTLDAVSTARTRIEREFDPEAVRRMKAAAERDLTVGGPALAATRSTPGWSTSATCCSPRSWSEAASSPYPTIFAWISSWWTNAVSATAWFTFATARGREDGDAARTFGPYAASAASAGSGSASSRGSRREITFVIPPSPMLTP